jgi:signal transduction histidine kinase
MSAPREKVNILLVDDQPARLLTYESILGELGQNLVTARSGLEALEKLMKHEFAVVLLDVSMPGMDGFETAAMIHDHPRFERTPIIFVTGVHMSELDRLRGYKAGAVDYVSIPVVPEILRSKVAVLVELHCQRRELEKLNRSLAEANARLEQANTTLQAEKTRELEYLNRHLQIANQELAQTNFVLEGEIAERLRVEKAMKEADRHKDEFLAMLAHELRNPLAPIRNAVQIMSRLMIDNPQFAWARDVIDRQVSHLTRLVDDLLDVSRITRSTINLNKEPIVLRTLLARAVETVQPMVAEFRHALTVCCEDDSLVIDGDLTRLTQVLGNLLTNAVKYTNPGGRIELIATRCGGHVEIRIKDNGIGIPPESIPKLFNLFSQLHRGSDKTQPGLGIGLALVRKLVEMHDGEVFVYSDGVDCGSEFTVRLPLKQSAGVLGEAPAPAVVRAAERSVPRRVLVADDNRDALDSLAILLECNGHEVCKATDGAEALDLAATWRPELALLDIGMPAMDGYEVARHIRSQPWGRSMVLVALSGWGAKRRYAALARSRLRSASGEAAQLRHIVQPAGAAVGEPTPEQRGGRIDHSSGIAHRPQPTMSSTSRPSRCRASFPAHRCLIGPHGHSSPCLERLAKGIDVREAE